MSPIEIAFVLLAAGFASVVKSMLGSGYPMILIPAIALFATVETAATIVAPANVAINALLAVELWNRRTETIFLGRFVVASVVGAAIGALILPIAPDRALRLVLVGVIVSFIVNRRGQLSRSLSREAAARYGPVVGGVAGVFQGATGVSGPIVMPWHLSLGLERDAFVLSVSVIYGLSSFAQLALIAGQGLFDTERLVLGLVLIPIALALAPIGSRLRRRLELAVFERLVIALLIASAVSLAVRSF